MILAHVIVGSNPTSLVCNRLSVCHFDTPFANRIILLRAVKDRPLASATEM